jgi:hypothetical protein
MKRRNALALTLGWAALVSLPMYAQETTTYNFETHNFPGDTFTQLLGINNADVIAGYHGATINMGFTLALPSSFTNENFPGSAQTQVIGINDSSQTFGFFIDTAGVTHGFTDQGGMSRKWTFPTPRSISCSDRTTTIRLSVTTAPRRTAPAPIMRTSLTSTVPSSRRLTFLARPARRPLASTIDAHKGKKHV